MTQRLEQLGPYTLVQREGVFPLGGDALALGGFATLRPSWRVCDLGTGSGALLLLLARREPGLELWGLDSSPAAVDCARESLAGSGLSGRLWTGPWSACPFPAGTFDLVVSNPPYFVPGAGRPGGPGRMEQESLDSLCAAAARLLRSGGRFALCHRPERLPQVMRGMTDHGLEPKRMAQLAPGPDRPARTVLLEGVRQGRPGLEILPTQYPVT